MRPPHAVGSDVAAGEAAAARQEQVQSIGAVLDVNYTGQLVEYRSRREKCAGICVGPARFAERAQVLKHRAGAAVKILVVLRVPQTVVVNDRAVAAQLTAAPIYRAVIGEETASEIHTGGGGVEVQHAAAAHGDHPIPQTALPGQSAFDDIRPDQIGAAHHHIAASGGSIDVKIAAAQMRPTHAVGSDVAAGETAAARQEQVQSIGAVLDVNYTGQLVEYRTRREKCAGICIGPARFAEPSQVVEHRAVEILVVLRVPQTVVVNERAVAAQLTAAPIYRAVVGEETASEIHTGGGGVEVQHAVAAHGDH